MNIKFSMQHLQLFLHRSYRYTAQVRFSEHQRYITRNNPRSAYVLHILNKRHEYGTMRDIREL
jgi:hypothetical protein